MYGPRSTAADVAVEGDEGRGESGQQLCLPSPERGLRTQVGSARDRDLRGEGDPESAAEISLPMQKAGMCPCFH
jgi:hypothetical protein